MRLLAVLASVLGSYWPAIIILIFFFTVGVSGLNDNDIEPMKKKKKKKSSSGVDQLVVNPFKFRDDGGAGAGAGAGDFLLILDDDTDHVFPSKTGIPMAAAEKDEEEEAQEDNADTTPHSNLKPQEEDEEASSTGLEDIDGLEKLDSTFGTEFVRNDDDHDDCQWKYPKHCRGSSSAYHIEFELVNHKTFPPELITYIQDALTFWSRAIVRRRQRTNTTAEEVEEEISISEHLSNAICNMSARTNWTNDQNPAAPACLDDSRKEPRRNMSSADLLIWFHYDEFKELEDDNVLGFAVELSTYDSDGLPHSALVGLNSKKYITTGGGDGTKMEPSPRLNRCQWTNVIAHEVGHALGFSNQNPAFQRKLINDCTFKGQKRTCFGGFRTMYEWIGLTDSICQFPPLAKSDESHWPIPCFENEMMLPTLDYHRRSGVDSHQRKRVPMSRMTLEVFADLGYEINYGCADEDVLVRRSWAARKVKKKKKKGRPQTRRGYEYDRYPSTTARPPPPRLIRKLTRSFTKWKNSVRRFWRRLCRRRRRILKGTNTKILHGGRRRGNGVKAIPQQCRKLYRRLRRVTKRRIRSFLKSDLAGRRRRHKQDEEEEHS